MSSDKKRVWEPLENYRKARNLSSRKVANLINATVAQVNEFESGYPQKLRLSNKEVERFIKSYCRHTGISPQLFINRWRKSQNYGSSIVWQAWQFLTNNAQIVGAGVIGVLALAFSYSLIVGVNDNETIKTIKKQGSVAINTVPRDDKGLRIIANSDCWVRLMSEGTLIILDQLLTAGEQVHYPSIQGYQLWIGNHKAVKILWQGELLESDDMLVHDNAAYILVADGLSPTSSLNPI